MLRVRTRFQVRRKINNIKNKNKNKKKREERM